MTISTESDINVIICPECGEDLRKAIQRGKQSDDLWNMSILAMGLSMILFLFGGDNLFLSVSSVCCLFFSCVLLSVSCLFKFLEELSS